eukprot:contig_33761_g8150
MGRAPTLALTANRQAAGLPTGISLSITTSDAFQYCVDTRRRHEDVSLYVFSRLLSLMSEVIVEHGEALQARGVLSLGPGDRSLADRSEARELRWFTYSLNRGDEDRRLEADPDMVALIGFHCNVYFFSGYFYPTDDPPGGVRYELDGRGIWRRTGPGPYFDVKGEPAFQGPVPPAYHVLSPLPPMPPANDTGEPRRVRRPSRQAVGGPAVAGVGAAAAAAAAVGADAAGFDPPPGGGAP